MLKWNGESNNRVMPWKGESDPYKIWLSEIILQQTRVEQGLSYYNRFVDHFPSICDLASATDQEVFKLWEGLGYYSRCHNLLATARQICNAKQGIFPKTYSEILQLKGIGPYTAAAIASFAYNLPYAVVDGNVFRVLARVFNIQEPIDSAEGKKIFNKLAQHLLNREEPGKYNQAIMDFGATICKPVAPLCQTCIFQSNCVAYAENNVAALPVKSKKLKIKTRYFYFFELIYQGQTILLERKEKDIWRHLFTFPGIELDQTNQATQAIGEAQKMGWIKEPKEIENISSIYTQKLTHQFIEACFIKVNLTQKPETFDHHNWISANDISKFSFPKILNDYLSSIKKASNL